MKIRQELICADCESHPVYVYHLEAENGMSADVTNVGATVLSLETLAADGSRKDVLLGNADPLAGLRPGPMFGATLGRCSGRLETGAVTISGKTYQLTKNNGENHSHGGKRGFDKRLWERDDSVTDKLVLKYLSEDGEEGYPGNLEVSVIFSFEADNIFRISYQAKSDKDTLVSISNHMYFNLNGMDARSVLTHEIRLDADEVSLINQDAVPTGEHLKVEGTPFDFRQGKPLGRDIREDHPLLRNIGTYDHNFILNSRENGPVLTASASESGIKMEVSTSLPALHFYAADFSGTGFQGKAGCVYDGVCAFCVEPQYTPNAIRTGEQPSPLLKAGEEYSHYISYKFTY